MVPLRGDETPNEIIILAYGMEKGLGEFYTALSRSTDDSELTSILTKLAGIEENHRKKLFNLFTNYSDVSDMETFESSTVSKMMEGGFTTEEFLKEHGPSLQTVVDVLNAAMMLETQALDLYLRYSQNTKEEKSRVIFYAIAEDEKAHLAALGKLMEKTYEEGD
ncbi:MAG: ferritin family protein [Thermodesulfobacteriota bacterium]|nr:ferritin family protein [Thermodesulfobacteriota bacterium]